MKKIFTCFIIIVCAAALCSCSHIEYTGRERIEKARALHTALEGADIAMTDNISGETVQRISYLFVGEVMTYMYEGHEDGKTYYEFNNGTELNRLTIPGDTEWSFAARGSEDYYGYSKAGRHYFADGARLFAVYEGAVGSAEMTDSGVKYAYDESKLSEYQAFAGMDVHDFTMSYMFDENGYCSEFTNEYTLDGKRFSYTVKISPRTEAVTRTEVEIS